MKEYKFKPGDRVRRTYPCIAVSLSRYGVIEGGVYTVKKCNRDAVFLTNGASGAVNRFALIKRDLNISTKVI